MVATPSMARGEYVPTADQRLVMHRVPWSHYEAQLALRGEAPVPRISYLDGALEFMSPSKDHERIKSYIGRLIEVYALERGLDLSPYGSWTLKRALAQVGAEPDECYIIGTDQSKECPDLAIEIVWTRGGVDKLEIYRRLGIAEVWFWIDGRIAVHVLSGDVYQLMPRSACLPDLDLDRLCSFLDRPTAIDAMRAWREELRRVE